MTHFNFYRQQRRDGGIRTGLDCDDGSSLHGYEPGEGEEDPALLWYIDLRGQVADDLDALEIRDWLKSHEVEFRGGLQKLAERFSAGIDIDTLDWPVREDFPMVVADAALTIVISAIRRFDALEIGRKFREIADRWDEILDELEPVLEST